MKKFISIILCLSIILAMSTTTFASETDAIPAVEDTGITIVGETFYYNAETGEAIAENGEPVYFDDIEIKFQKPSSDPETRTSFWEIYLVKGGLKSTSSGTFKWFFNVDCPTSIINKPHMKITVQLKGNFTNGISFSNVGSSVYHEYKTNSEYGIDYTFTSPAKTGWYYYSFTIVDYDLGQTATNTTSSILYNRTGHPWTFSFSDTGKSLGYPRCDWTKGATHTRPSNLATKYYADYKAATGKTLNSSLYDVHHIRPLSYGGDNSYSNLIHLPKATHTSVTSWFAGY